MSRKMQQAAETIAKAIREQGPLPQIAEGIQLAYLWDPSDAQLNEIAKAGVYPVAFVAGEGAGSDQTLVRLVIGPLDKENGKFPEITVAKVPSKEVEKYR